MRNRLAKIAIFAILSYGPYLTIFKTHLLVYTIKILKAWAKSDDPDQTALEEQSDQGLHCLPFHLYLLDSLLYGRATLFKF